MYNKLARGRSIPKIADRLLYSQEMSQVLDEIRNSGGTIREFGDMTQFS
jgi:hypothetical protein